MFGFFKTQLFGVQDLCSLGLWRSEHSIQSVLLLSRTEGGNKDKD